MLSIFRGSFVDLRPTLVVSLASGGIGRKSDPAHHKTQTTIHAIYVAAVWSAFIILNSRFDRWVVLGGSGAASSGHFRPILGGPGGPGRNSKYICLIASKKQPRIPLLTNVDFVPEVGLVILPDQPDPKRSRSGLFGQVGSLLKPY